MNPCRPLIQPLDDLELLLLRLLESDNWDNDSIREDLKVIRRAHDLFILHFAQLPTCDAQEEL